METVRNEAEVAASGVPRAAITPIDGEVILFNTAANPVNVSWILVAAAVISAFIHYGHGAAAV